MTCTLTEKQQRRSLCYRQQQRRLIYSYAFLCSMDRASYNMSIIIQKDATEYSLFKSVNCSTCFGWYFTHLQELITLYLQYLVLMRPVLLPVVYVAGFSSSHIHYR